jgi:hypothetical protein
VKALAVVVAALAVGIAAASGLQSSGLGIGQDSALVGLPANGSANAQHRSPAARAATVSDNWYGLLSPWNTPIPPDPPVTPNSTSLIKAMNEQWCPPTTSSNGGVSFTRCIGPGFVSTPSVWIATGSTPSVTLQVNYPRCNARQVQVPIPSIAEPSSYDDDPEPVMAVMESQTGVEWDFFKITKPGVTPKSSGPICAATSNWAATAVFRKDPGWTGAGTGGGSTRASGTWLGSGMIRKRDAQMPAGSTWDHALAFAYPGTLSRMYVWPATGTDGTCSDTERCIPMGARVQMDPALNCATWPSLVGEWQRQLCRTLQRYGMIIVDTGAGLITEQLASVRPYVYPWEATGWKNLPSDITPYLRVLDWRKWGRPPSLLVQLRPYWTLTAQKRRTRLVVSVSNAAAPRTTRIPFRICAKVQVPGGKPRCKSGALQGPEHRTSFTFRVGRSMTKSWRFEIIAGGNLQARRTIRPLR